MAKVSMSAEERAGAVSVISAGYDEYDDVQNAFDDFRAGLDQSQTPGEIRAFELLMDERGTIQTTKAQIRLGSWPIDAYSFDELCSMIVRDFMDPGVRRMAVRLIGSRPGSTGTPFNKIVVLKKRENVNGTEKETTASLMRAIQENNKELMAQFRAMIPPKPDHDPTTELAKIIAISTQLNAPMMTMLQSLLPALAGRPTPALPDPLAGLSGIVDLAARLAELRGGGESEAGGADWLQALKAVVPLARPALEAIMATRPVAVMQPRPVLAPPPGSTPTPPPPAATRAPDGSQPSQPIPPTTPAAGPMSMGDIPSGDIEMFAQLKPQIDSLVQIAKDGGDPVGAADLLFDEMILPLPDDYYNRFSDMFSRENLVSQLAVFHPAVLQYREFFEKFRKQVDARFDKEDVEAGDRPTNLESVK